MLSGLGSGAGSGAAAATVSAGGGGGGGVVGTRERRRGGLGGVESTGETYDYINPAVKERESDQSHTLRWQVAGRCITQGETGDRNICFGHDSLGDG